MPTHQLSHDDRLGNGRTASDLWTCGLDYAHIDEDRFARILDRLPPKQADLIELTRRNVSQAGMAAFFGCTQPAISVALARAIKAVRVLLSLPDISEESIVRDLTPHFPPDIVELLRAYFRTGNCVWTAHAVGCQGTDAVAGSAMRRKVIRAVRLLHDIPEARDYVAFFGYALDNAVPWAHTNAGVANRRVAY